MREGGRVFLKGALPAVFRWQKNREHKKKASIAVFSA
jgi:hypothetical protein